MKWLGILACLFGFIAMGFGMARASAWGWSVGSALWHGAVDMIWITVALVAVLYGSLGIARLTNRIKQRLDEQESKDEKQ